MAPVEVCDLVETTSADWLTSSGGRISFGLNAVFDTPQGVELDRGAGHR